ncbi:MAG: EamA family transporter [Candidatus Bipolaricaulota bacterium]
MAGGVKGRDVPSIVSDLGTTGGPISVQALALALAASAAWGIGMTAAVPAIRYVDRLTYLVVRWGLVALFALAYAVATRALAIPSLQAAGYAVLAGFIDATLGGLLYLMALERTSAYRATTLSNTAPLWGVFAAILFLGEAMRWQAVVAAILAVAGAAFLVERRDAQRGRGKGLAGTLYALATGVLWGVAETVPAKLALDRGLSSETLLLLFAASGALGAALLLPFLRRRVPARFAPRGLGYIVLSGIVGAGVGWLLWLESLRRAAASSVAPVRGATLLFCLLFSVLFLRERPTPRALWGVLLAGASVALISLGV